MDNIFLADIPIQTFLGIKPKAAMVMMIFGLLKITDNYNLISGNLFIDDNSNGIQDVGET